MFSVLTKDFASFLPIVTRNFVLVTKFGLAGPSFLHPTQKYATIGQNSSHSERKRSFSMARSDGYNTKTRQLILDYLINNRQHAVSASNILEHLEEQGASPNPTTVYRYLDKLAGEQRIMKYVADKGEKAVFQYVDEGRHCREHLHLNTALRCSARAAFCTDCAATAHKMSHSRSKPHKNVPAVLTRAKSRDTMQAEKALNGKSKVSRFFCRERRPVEAAQRTKPE